MRPGGGGVGVEIRESPVSDEEFAEMTAFVHDYLAASVESEDDGGRMRWYPWHSAEYRFNHILNVVDLAEEIARDEGANVDVTRVAALFHDIAKLEVDQDLHAEEGARIAREYLRSHGDFPESFVEEVCLAVERHSYQGELSDLPLETRCLVEADLLDKVGANGTALMLLRMGYESRTHTDAAESIIHRRLKRVKWFKEWLESEVASVNRDEDLGGVPTGMHETD